LKNSKKSGRPRSYVARQPPNSPILRPEYRYCGRDEIVKPFRAHHCRICGTCVLKYDHHCPWIGQCVGARNHKFFVNFLQAASVFTLYTFATLLGFSIDGTTKFNADFDPQYIVIIALSVLFAILTTILLISHVLLIWSGQSTVENIHMHEIQARESRALDRAFSWWDCGAKRRMRREWDEEWGDMSTEGNLWWLGSRREGWEDVMGKSVWGWFLPVGRSQSDGLTYPVNPRFDEEGRLRRRTEWPKHLQ